VTEEDRELGPPERLHPFYLMTGLGRRLRGVAGAYAAMIYLAAKGLLTAAIIGAVALLLISLCLLFLHWKRFAYRVGPSEIRIDSGILTRTHRSIPFDRVQDVDVIQGPLMRLLGLATVKFETGGSGSGPGGGADGQLQVISLERAQQLRSLVRAHRSGAAAAAPLTAEAEQPPVYAMDIPRLLLAGLFNFSLAIFAALIGLSQTAGDLIGFDPFEREFWESLLSTGHPLARFMLEHRAAAAFAGLISLILVGVATGVVRTVSRDYGFRLDSSGAGLRRRRGLLTRTDVTLPASRAQAAIVASGPVRARFGWSELKLQSLAHDEGGKGDHVLAPLANKDEVDRILDALGWRQIGASPAWSGVSRAYVWGLAIALIPLALIATAEMLVVPVAGLAVLGVLAVPMLLRRLEWRRLGYMLDGDRLLIRKGWWRRTLLILPVRKIQSIDLNQRFLARWFGISSLRFGVAGGSGLSNHSIPAMPEEKARELRVRLLTDLA
jgi:putative membrane protein